MARTGPATVPYEQPDRAATVPLGERRETFRMLIGSDLGSDQVARSVVARESVRSGRSDEKAVLREKQQPFDIKHT